MEWSDGSLFRKVLLIIDYEAMSHIIRAHVMSQVKPNCLCCDARLVECDEHGVDVQVPHPRVTFTI